MDNRAKLYDVAVDFLEREDRMTESPVCYYKRKEPKKMPSWIISALLASVKPGIYLYRWLFLRPRLELVYRLELGNQGVKTAGRLYVAIENSGGATAREIFIELRIYKPQEVTVGCGLFFEDEKHVTHREVPGIWDSDKSLKPTRYSYRPAPHVFINPKQDPLKIAWFNVSAGMSEERLNHEIGWTVSCPGMPSRSNTMVLNGAKLRDKLLANRS